MGRYLPASTIVAQEKSITPKFSGEQLTHMESPAKARRY